MMRLLCLIVFLLVLTAQSYAQDVELLPISKLTISGFPGHESVRFPFLTKGLKIRKHLGKPDSIRPSGYECGSEASTIYYYQGIGFDLDPYLGVLPRALDLAKHKKLVLSYKGVKLSYMTTIEAFRKLFPKSGSLMSSDNSAWLQPFMGADDKLRFLFDIEGHLTLIEYWIPC
jgi:hypothetical protein